MLQAPPVRLTLLAAALLAAASPALRAQTPADPAALESVVVTGKGFEQRAFDTPYSASVVDAEALRNGGPMVNLSEALARVPGLTVANRSNYAQDLQINSRGYGARASFGVRGLRLYTDGIPASMPDGSGQVSHFDLAGAQRVEVLRGPFSALYGNSSGGVIALFSAPVRERFVQFDGDLGDDGMRQLRATIETPLSATPGRGFDLRASVSKFETDGFRPQSEAERTLGNIRLGWTGAQDTLVLQINHVDQPADDPLGLDRASFDADPYQTAPAAIDFNTRKTVEQTQVGLNWRHRFDHAGPLHESSVTAYTGQREVRQFQSIPTGAQNAQTSPGGVIDFDRDYLGVDGRLSFRWTLPGERRAQLVVGAAYEEAEDDRRGFRNFIGPQLGVLGEQRRDETNRATTTDVYAQGELDLSERWTATAGVRSGKIRFESDDRYCRNGGVQVPCSTPGPLANPDDSGARSERYTVPVAALQFRASPDLNLYLSAGEGFESPTLNELAYQAGGASGLNPDLDPQQSTQVELGAKWRPAGTGLALDVALFKARTEDEIVTLSNVGGRSVFTNADSKTTRRGVEVAAGWQISKALRSALALTYLHATYDDAFTINGVPIAAGNRIAGTSPRSFFTELAWRPDGSDRTEFGIEWLGRDKVAVNDANADFAGFWSIVNLRLGHGWRFGDASRLDLLARVDNLFDREYAGSVIVNEGNGRFFEPGAPRTWYLGLKWRQGF
jgi:iron complex outermembrane receptor protein